MDQQELQRRGSPTETATHYDPAARFEVSVSEVTLRQTPAGRTLMARIYRPQGAGPYPVLLDLHGGAWNAKDRFANEPMDRALAASGLVVAAIDLTLAAEAPYPASVQDANFGVRWLKANAGIWDGDASTLGVLGSSTGGHLAELLALRPHDARYNALALDGAVKVDASLAYVVTRAPISDPYARFLNAQKMDRKEMMQNTTNYFKPWESIFEGNPQQILDRTETVALPPLLIMQGALDDNLLQAVQEKFAASYRAAGGACRLEVFEGCAHEWVSNPGPETERTHALVKAFIADSLGSGAHAN